jgi:hypothetical protein
MSFFFQRTNALAIFPSQLGQKRIPSKSVVYSSLWIFNSLLNLSNTTNAEILIIKMVK